MKLTTCKECLGAGETRCPTCGGAGEPCDRGACNGGWRPCYGCEGAGEVLSLAPVLAVELAAELFKRTPCASCAVGNGRVQMHLKPLHMSSAPVAAFTRQADGKTWAWQSGDVGPVAGASGASADMDELVQAALTIPMAVVTDNGYWVIMRLGHFDAVLQVLAVVNGDLHGRLPAEIVRKAIGGAHLPVPRLGALLGGQGGTVEVRAVLAACQAILATPMH